jgi:outer membrane protein, multidrug efflux system
MSWLPPLLPTRSAAGRHEGRKSGGPLAVALLAGLLQLAGCMVGPEYHRPAALGTNTVPDAYSGAFSTTNGPTWKVSEPSAHLPRGTWWDVFGDPELNHLETLATAANQELQAAAARLEQARASITVARSGLFPQVTLDPAYTRQRTSVDQPQLGRAAGTSYTFDTLTLPLEAGWELDLWGRVRRQVEAARSRLAATSDDLEAARLAIQAEVAIDYFALRSAQSETDIVLRSVQTYGRSLELTRNRRAGGIASDLDVSQAETQLRATEAQLPALALQESRLRNALAALCGQPATGFRVNAGPAVSSQAPMVPPSLPSELLERRPDIAAAERRMAAANAEVGVAQTAFYPRVRLTGVAGFQSISASTLFDWPARIWAVGPSLDLPLFTGGRNRAELAIARAAYDEAVARYRQSVLAAFQEVEDQLAAGRLLTAQLEAEQAALEAARRTLEIANNRYKAGLVTYLEVAISQSAALARERAVVQIQAQRLTAATGLIRALGGGWSG